MKELGLSNVLVAGDASPQAAAVIEGAEDAGERHMYVHSADVCLCAAEMALEGQLVNADELRPYYLQPSQAERNRNNL